MKSIITILVTFLAATAARAADPWTVAIIAPTTGPIATVGARILTAVQYWEDATNKQGGIKGRSIKVITCNDEGSPEKSVTCGRSLLDQKPVILLQCSVTGPILATMPLVANGPVMLTSSPNVLPPPESFVFQTSPADADITQSIADYMKASHVDHIGVIAATDASGEVGVASVTSVFPKNGIKYDLARIDLKANDASIQLSNVARNNPLIYSNYSGAGAAAVVKSYSNLGLTQPLIVSYANISDAFTNLIKSDLPDRLLGTGILANVPDLITDKAQRAHLDAVTAGYTAWKHDHADNLTLQGLILADIVASVLQNVPDPTDAKAVRSYLETTPVKGIQTVTFSPQRHIGMTAQDIAIEEFKDGTWIKAAPLK